MTTPLDIYQEFLDDTSSRLWNGDAAGVAAKLIYPHVIVMPEAERIIPDADHQQRDAEAFRASLRGLAATAYHRVARQARYAPDTSEQILGHHTTYILRGGSYLTDPYECEMSLRLCEDGQWRSDKIHVKMTNSSMAYYHFDIGRDRARDRTSK